MHQSSFKPPPDSNVIVHQGQKSNFEEDLDPEMDTITQRLCIAHFKTTILDFINIVFVSLLPQCSSVLYAGIMKVQSAKKNIK